MSVTKFTTGQVKTLIMAANKAGFDMRSWSPHGDDMRLTFRSSLLSPTVQVQVSAGENAFHFALKTSLGTTRTSVSSLTTVEQLLTIVHNAFASCQ